MDGSSRGRGRTLQTPEAARGVHGTAVPDALSGLLPMSENAEDLLGVYQNAGQPAAHTWNSGTAPGLFEGQLPYSPTQGLVGNQAFSNQYYPELHPGLTDMRPAHQETMPSFLDQQVLGLAGGQSLEVLPGSQRAGSSEKEAKAALARQKNREVG